ncbi:transglycosylase family protein [Streptomyces sp. NBC_01497]|uniref:transglycosylase family protein n=1 Tax=Streptomyces sp. NBC_01497 TaxID=2903885 RepID=UPI002E32940C|nr:transglycosylase family protein [Streptomyces sp. NBC_01497]
MSGNGRHRRPRQAPAIVVAAGVTGSAIAIPLLGAASAHAADASTWDKVAACESGGQWSANLSNGYFGGLQITQDTWDQFGGSDYAARPDLATKSQQIAVAEKILAGQGPQTWASCADSAGLPQSKPAPSSDGSGTDGGGLGAVLGGLLGGSHGSGGSAATNPSGTPATTGGTATPDPSGSSQTSGGTATGDDGTSGTPNPSASPSGSASPGVSGSGHGKAGGGTSARGGKHRAATPGTAPSTDDGGFPLSVSRDNSGGLASGSETSGAGSIGNSDLPGVVPDSGATPVIHIPFAPHYSGTHAGGASRSLFQFPDEVTWTSPDAAPAGAAARATATPSATGTPSGTQGAQGALGAPGGVGASGTPSSAAVPGGTGAPGTTTVTPAPSGSAVTGGKHRGGAATEASRTSTPTSETDGGGQTGQTGRQVGSGDTSSDAGTPAADSGARYTVHAGDSLSGIAVGQRVDGGWQALYEANKAALGSDPNHIVPGQSLSLPVG